MKNCVSQHRAESERLLGVFGDLLAGVREALGPAESKAEGTGPDGPDGDDEQTAVGDAEPIAVVAERTGRMLLKTLAGGRRGGRAVGRAPAGVGASRQQLHPR